MKQDELMKRLGAPFLPDEIEWRVQSAGLNNDGEPWAIVVPYVQSRAIQQRFDETVGPFGWQTKFLRWHENSQLCGIGIHCDDDFRPNEWVWKFDGAENTKIESIKGGISDALKRTAVQWGIGRYLYSIPKTYAKCSLKKIKDWHSDSATDRESKKKYRFWWKTPQLPAQALPDGFHYRESAATGSNFNEPELAGPSASDQMQDDFDRILSTLKKKMGEKFGDDKKGAKDFLLSATSHLPQPIQSINHINKIDILENILYKLENPRATDEEKLKFDEELKETLKGKKITPEEWLKKLTAELDYPLVSTAGIKSKKQLRFLKAMLRKEFGRKAAIEDEGDPLRNGKD